MNLKKVSILVLFAVFFNFLKASDYTLEELDQFLKEGLVTIEEYEILKSELLGTGDANTEYLYEITLNNTLRNSSFKAKIKDKKIYFPLLEFFSIINLTNYELKDQKLNALLGENLKEFNVDLKRQRIESNGEKIKYRDEVYSENGDIYILSDLFAKLLTDKFEKDDNNFKIKTELKFKTPYEIKNQIENRLDRFKDENSKNTIVFKNENKLFDLGYLRIKSEYNYAEKTKDGDLKSSLEYQGGFLYGELTTSYDIDDKQLGDVTIYYPEIYKGHSLEVGSYGFGNRELGLSLKKEKGYLTEGSQIVIKENVPIGSRVELIYLGFPIDVKDSINGVVEFSGSEVRMDRDYSLKIYSEDGTISVIEISTNKSYNQQAKGEIEYDFDIREDSQSSNFRGNVNIYYGLTDNLTFGIGVNRFFEGNEEDELKDITAVNPELVYGNSFMKNDYTFVFGSEYVDSHRNIKYFESEFNYKNMKFRSDIEMYDKYYKDELKQRYTVEYNASAFQIVYNYSDYKYRDFDGEKKSSEVNYDVGMNYNLPFKDLLLTADYRINRDSVEDYSLSVYYTGYYLFNTKLTNRWSNSGKNYNTSLAFNNKNLNSNFNYSLVFDYSNSGEEAIGIKFQLDIDNWLDIGIVSPASRNTSYRIGVDKVVDLKNVRKNIKSMNSSRVKIITFLDDNNNNIFDEGEKRLPYNEIEIGQNKVMTNENGEAWVFGVSNNILYDMNLTIQRPSYSIGENNLKVQGNRTGTIEAYIPVKAKVNLIGQIKVTGRNISEKNRYQLMQELSVRVKNPNGELIEKLPVEEDGLFILSDIYPGNYSIEILYWGEMYSIDKIEKAVQLRHLNGDDDIIDVNLNLN